jgi:hypothetical protein
MSSPSVATIKRLFALSGNRCAFPKCPLPLVDMLSGKATGRICHIRAQSVGGPRFDASQTESDRHGFDNLTLLCPIHHDVVDSDVEAYSVDRLLSMKHDHELSNAGGGEVPDEIAAALIRASSVRVTDGAVLIAVGHSNGQVAQTINNVFGQPNTEISSAAVAKFQEKQMEIYGELWQQLGRAQGAVYRIAGGLRRIRNVDHVSDDEFHEFVEQSGFTVTEKRRLLETNERTATLSEISWSTDLREAMEMWRGLHNYMHATKIFQSDILKSLLSQAAALVSRVVTHAEIARTEDKLNFEATLSWLEELDRLMASTETRMGDEMRGT